MTYTAKGVIIYTSTKEIYVMKLLSNALVIHSKYAKFDRATCDFIEGDITAQIFERDGHIYCMAEGENSHHFADYYGETHPTEAPWINPELDAWAKKHYGKDAYWEWENAGTLCLAV